MASVVATKENFSELVDKNDLVIFDFWAPWCGPCKSFGPIFEAMSDQYTDVVFAKVNTEEQQELAAAFQIRSIPTTVIFREKIIIFAQPGALPQSALEDVITQAKALDMDAVRQQLAEQQAGQDQSA